MIKFMSINMGSFKAAPITYFFKFDREATEEDIKILISKILGFVGVRRFQITYDESGVEGVTINFSTPNTEIYLSFREILTITFELGKSVRLDKFSSQEFLNQSKHDKELEQNFYQSAIVLKDLNPDFDFEINSNKYNIKYNKNEEK